MSVTACLVSWKRQYHLPEIVEEIRKCPDISEIIVWQNEVPLLESTVSLPCRTIYSPENRGVYGRFLAAQQAKNDLIFVQDDDLLVHNISELLGEFQNRVKFDSLSNLADDQSSKHWQWWQVHKPPYVELGFGSILKKSAALKLRHWPHGPECLNRKADKIFTVMNNWDAIRADSSCLTRLKHNGIESGWDENALWLRTDHKKLTERAVLLAQQWKVSCENVGT